MSKQLTVSSTSKHRLQIIDTATDFTEKHLSLRHILLFPAWQPGQNFLPSSLLLGVLQSSGTWCDGCWRRPAGSSATECRLASSSSESHPVFVLAQPAHRSSHPLHQIFKAQGTSGMWLKNIRGSASERGASAWYERGEVQVRTVDELEGTVIGVSSPSQTLYLAFQTRNKTTSDNLLLALATRPN